MSENTLEQLRQKVAGKHQLEAKLKELRTQKWEYERKVVSLRVAFRKEQEDVEKLEGRSLSNYFFAVIGKLDDKLDQERQEAYAAKVKLDAAQGEIQRIEQDISRILAELSEIGSAEEAYTRLLEKKRKELTDSGTETGEQILTLEEGIALLEAQKKEIREAISAGLSARGTAEQILSELNSADNWNTWDLIGGGGIITHVAKHSHLDSAQDLVSELQSKLRRFKTELADIQIQSDVQVNIDGFLRFADYFFDGLFADWAVGSRISQSYDSVSSTRSKITRTIEKLEQMQAAADSELARLKAQLDELIVKA
ncbi:MAG: hypothetical protein IJZ39_09240 [Oscillospiraceae bacterium]|nr:hypothetical protein [Oscillospiraceae bacterium]